MEIKCQNVSCYTKNMATYLMYGKDLEQSSTSDTIRLMALTRGMWHRVIE